MKIKHIMKKHFYSWFPGIMNIICETAITDLDGRSFAIPDKIQPLKLHDAIVQTQIFQKVKATLQRRHEKRQMNSKMKAVCCGDGGNKQFMGYLLDEQTTNFFKRNFRRISSKNHRKLR